jgi:hypothetical protein
VLGLKELPSLQLFGCCIVPLKTALRVIRMAFILNINLLVYGIITTGIDDFYAGSIVGHFSILLFIWEMCFPSILKREGGRDPRGGTEAVTRPSRANGSNEGRQRTPHGLGKAGTGKIAKRKPRNQEAFERSAGTGNRRTEKILNRPKLRLP